MAHQYTTMVIGWINVVNNVQPCRCSANGMRRRSDVVVLSGLAEVRWTESGKLTTDDHVIVYSGHYKEHTNGVGVLLTKQVADSDSDLIFRRTLLGYAR